MIKNIFLILFLFGSLIIAQNSKLPINDTLAISDSLSKIGETTSLSDSIKPMVFYQSEFLNTDSVKQSNKLTSDTTNVAINDDILPQFKIPELNIFKEIDFFTFLELFFLVLISIGITKLIDFVSKINNLKQRIVFFKVLFGTIKAIIWFVVFYIVFNTIMPNSNEFIFLLILIVFIIITVALIPLIKNFIGGIYLSITMPFSVGDFIKIGEFEGEVESINWKDVVLIADGTNILSIPNSLFLTNTISNFKRQQKEQLVSITFDIPFKHEPEKVINIIYEAALSSPYFYSKMKHKVLLIKNDFIAQKRTFQLNVYIIDVKFTDNLIHSLNMVINRAISEDK
jgi:small-conductance mechanosensitive channel